MWDLARPLRRFMNDHNLKKKIVSLKPSNQYFPNIKNPEQVRHFVITLSILIAAGSIFEYRLI